MCSAPDEAGRDRAGCRAFNLIEVVIALGVCSFAIVAILGLMSVGVTSSKESAQDTVVAIEARYVASDLKRQPYPPAATNYYFDPQGEPTNAPGYYHCTVAIAANPVPFAWGSSCTNVTGIKLTFTWPGQTNTSGSNAKILWTALPAY